MKLSSEDLARMKKEIEEAGGKIHSSEPNSIIHTWNIWCMPPAWVTAQETAEIVYMQRKQRGQVWSKAYGT